MQPHLRPHAFVNDDSGGPTPGPPYIDTFENHQSELSPLISQVNSGDPNNVFNWVYESKFQSSPGDVIDTSAQVEITEPTPTPAPSLVRVSGTGLVVAYWGCPDLGQTDMYIEATRVTTRVPDFAGPAIRCGPGLAAVSRFFSCYPVAGDAIRLFRSDGTTFGDISNITPGKRIRIEAVGSTVTLFEVGNPGNSTQATGQTGNDNAGTFAGYGVRSTFDRRAWAGDYEIGIL